LNAIYKALDSEIKPIDLAVKNVITISIDDTLDKAAKLMDEYGISQLIVTNKDNKILGSIREKTVTKLLLEQGKKILYKKIMDYMDGPFPEISEDTPFELVKTLVLNNDAVVLISNDKLRGLITKADIIKYFHK